MTKQRDTNAKYSNDQVRKLQRKKRHKYLN